jgi:hypothetical protein
MAEQLERRIGQAGGVLLVAVVGLGIAEVLGYVDVISLAEFLVLFVGLGVSMTILRWWAA